MEDKYFLELVLSTWVPFSYRFELSPTTHLLSNFKYLKNKVVAWEKNRKNFSRKQSCLILTQKLTSSLDKIKMVDSKMKRFNI